MAEQKLPRIYIIRALAHTFARSPDGVLPEEVAIYDPWFVAENLRTTLTELRKERDELRAALEEIERIGTTEYEGEPAWNTQAMLAREALRGETPGREGE